jgi:GAF domain
VREEIERQRRREAVLAGRSASVRPVVAASWRRMRSRGLDPGGGPRVAPLTGAELERRRAESPLAPLLPHLRRALAPAVEQSGLLAVVSDADGRVLWRSGGTPVRRLADRLGFVGGSAWTEGNVGTNAIGTALVLDAPVMVQGGEHFVDSHTFWGCAATPVHDPWTGRTLGVLDVSGPAPAMHPHALAMVQLAAQVAELQVREQHRAGLDRLRAYAAPLVHGLSGPALVVDPHGHVAAAVGTSPPARVPLPDDLAVGTTWLPTLGPATAEAVPGGWLLRLGGATPGASQLVLDLAGDVPTVTVSGPSGTWTHRPSPRHTELLLALVRHPEGRSARELALDLFADDTRVVTVRAELSRLRRSLGPVLEHQPYRLSSSVEARIELPADAARLLPGSSAPVVTALRQESASRQ